MTAALLLACCVAAQATAASRDAAAPVPAPTVVRDWRVIGPLDERGRRAFNPSAVVARHLLDRDAAPPATGEKLRGERNVELAWEERAADGDGRVGGSPLAAAYAALEWPRDEVVLADLDGAATLWINGTPQIGDLYGDGHGALPVRLRAGRNDLFVTGLRGAFRLAFEPVAAPLQVAPFDTTRPDLVAGEPTSVLLGIVVVNASDEALPQLDFEIGSATADGPFERRHQTDRAGVAPRSLRKLPLLVEPRPNHPVFAQPGSVSFPIQFSAGGRRAHATITLEVKARSATRRATYWSAVDGSVQEYAIVPPSDGEAEALVLTLHGAGVDALGQANSYAPKEDFWIVAPTNRRRFGFDWQDWGRRDAYDVLEVFCGAYGIDKSRLYLTGHSMGGHGTWHLAANDPATFAAIAPSAGWASFDSYGGRPAGARAALWQAADGASKTMTLLDNLVQLPTYVVHGTGDDNVPVGEAQALVAALTAAGAPPAAHFEPGAGHWWDGPASPGVDCVDWPPLFDHFRAARRPPLAERVRLSGNDPSTQASCEWARVVTLERYGEPFALDGRFDPATRTVTMTTRNVRSLQLQAPDAAPGVRFVVDGTELPEPRLPPWFDEQSEEERQAARDERSTFRDLERRDGAWREIDHETPAALAADGTPLPRAKESGSGYTLGGGPFKRAFDNEFVLVFGTQGDAAEDRELLDRARHDAMTWWYRGNGHALLLSDVRWLQLRATAGEDEWLTHVILYGNRDSNAAWGALVADDAVFDARRGQLRLRDQTFAGDALAGAVVLRSPLIGLVGLCADTGARGTRVGYALTPFISGVGYPDFTLFSAEVFTAGDGGVLAAGWFDADWRVQEE
ncbi:MAG: prolyl oligopeptidase family serine peptidase [Planctomycetes bacterium]|nr:prolyl oligopeptidase family serine peptidase [Planctomycetota bacterium]